MKKILLVLTLFCTPGLILAQVDFDRQFTNGKQLFRDGKYNLAMEMFKPLIPYDRNNPYAEYAAFYYAVSAYQQGYKAVARDQFNQIRTLHPKWERIDEVNFWLSRIHLDNGDYFQGLKVLSSINDRKMQKDIDGLKYHALQKVTDLETLRMMREEYPKDEVVARRLARALSNNLADPENLQQLESIINAHNFKRAEFIPEAPRSFTKDRYAVSVMMPFMVNTLEPTAGKKRNQIVLDFYEGMKLAADTLRKGSVNIDVLAYDTERDARRIKTLLGSDEILNTDLIVGPFFLEESKPILDFALEKQINIINPFFNNSELTEGNPYSFLFQPATETIGREVGEFMSSYGLKNKNCLVFSGPTRRDSLLARSFIESATTKGLQVVAYKAINRETVKDILDILATPTEYDEFKYPKEFTMKKDSIGGIFVASDDPLIYAKVVSGVETRGDQVVVVGSESWLEQTVVDFEKYQTLPIILSAPTFIASTDPDLAAFNRKYVKVHGKLPSAHAKLGYELMLFAGNQLRQHGVYFQEGLDKKNFIPGVLFQGFNFQYSRNNQFVPFIRYDQDKLRVIE